MIRLQVIGFPIVTSDSGTTSEWSRETICSAFVPSESIGFASAFAA